MHKRFYLLVLVVLSLVLNQVWAGVDFGHGQDLTGSTQAAEVAVSVVPDEAVLELYLENVNENPFDATADHCVIPAAGCGTELPPVYAYDARPAINLLTQLIFTRNVVLRTHIIDVDPRPPRHP